MTIAFVAAVAVGLAVEMEMCTNKAAFSELFVAGPAAWTV